MENKKLYIGLGIAAIAGFAIWHLTKNNDKKEDTSSSDTKKIINPEQKSNITACRAGTCAWQRQDGTWGCSSAACIKSKTGYSNATGKTALKRGEKVCIDGKVFIYTGIDCGVGVAKNINTDANGNCPKGYNKMDNSPLGYVCQPKNLVRAESMGLSV